MTFKLSSPLTFITLLTLLLQPYFTTAQFIPASIGNIRLEITTGDLFKQYVSEDGSFTTALFVMWDYFDASARPIGRSASTFDESAELIAGSAEAAGNDVVDIGAIHADQSQFTYWYPASLPLGLYHWRINSTVNTTIETSVIQNLTARSATFNVTLSQPLGCDPIANPPAPFTNVPSPTSPEFHSLMLAFPYAGQSLVKYSAIVEGFKNTTDISWQYRDLRNNDGVGNGVGISNVTVQFQESATGSAIGPMLSALPASSTASQSAITVDLNNIPVKVGESYKLLISYRNNIQDGIVAPGNTISFTSQEFNVMLEDINFQCVLNATAAMQQVPTFGSSGGRVLPAQITSAVTVLVAILLLLA